MRLINNRYIPGILITAFCFPVLNTLYAQEESPNSKKAVQILQALNAKLNPLETISYNYKREYFDGYEYTVKQGRKFVEFNLFNNPKDIKCIVYAADSDTIVHNGVEYFHVDSKNKNIIIEYPAGNTLESSSYFYYSLVSWKNSLAAVIADTTIKKTVSDSDINNEPCNVVTLSIFKKVLAYLGGIYEVTDTINFTFKLTVSQKTKWPVLTIVSNNANKHKAVIYYTGIEPEPKVPDDKYFYYSSYTGTKIYTNQATNRLLQVGTKAPEFTVASLINNQAVSLSNGKGKITIVEFFIRNCGPYIAAIPELNKLHEQYSSKLEILAVNPTDKLPAIQLFKNQYQPLYKIGINGEAVAKQYGVQGFPATFIVNKEGLIIYSGEGFDIKKIEAVLKKEFL